MFIQVTTWALLTHRNKGHNQLLNRISPSKGKLELFFFSFVCLSTILYYLKRELLYCLF